MSSDLLAEFDSFYQSPAPVQNQTFGNQQQQSQNSTGGFQGSQVVHKEPQNVFGGYGEWNTSTSTPAINSQGANTWGLWHNAAPAPVLAADDVEDDWGDFETGQDSKQSEIQAVSAHSDGGTLDSSSHAGNAPAYTKPTNAAPDNSMYSLYPLPQTQKDDVPQRPKAQPKLNRGPRDENVLFDAEEDEEEEEFGDLDVAEQTPNVFKTNKPAAAVNTTSVAPKQQLVPSLMDFDNMFEEMPSASNGLEIPAARPALTQGLSSFEGWTQNTGQPQNGSRANPEPQVLETNPSATFEDSAWDDFQDSVNLGIPTQATKQQNETNRNAAKTQPNDIPPEIDGFGWDDLDMNTSHNQGYVQPQKNYSRGNSTTSKDNNQVDNSRAARVETASRSSLYLDSALPRVSTSSSSATAPPDNIPPPAILLPLFAPIFNLAQTQLFEPLSHQTTSTATREAILAHPETQTFLVSYLTIMEVLARIIAGRKLRWKRDTLLAQSMRIGPASSSGKGGGMKLAGVDKAENAKEEREVNDILTLWRSQLGRLRSTVAGAGTGTVPELSENSIVRTAKESEGALTAPRACALCALKRNERLAKVDTEVEDSFGEWWVEHWGHRVCKSFWDVHKENLHAR